MTRLREIVVGALAGTDLAEIRVRVAEVEAANERLDAEKAELVAEKAELVDRAERQQGQIEELCAEVSAKTAQIEQLQHRLDQLARQLFGRKADKVDPAQLILDFGEEVEAGDESPPEAPPFVDEAPDDESAPSTGTKKRRGNGRAKLPANLPRERQEILPPPEERRCEGCDCDKVPIGEDVTEILEYEPAVFRVIEQVRIKVACPRCRSGISCAPPEGQPLEKGRAGPGLLAEIVTRKYGDHLPLNRLERIFARYGLTIAKSTLCDWVRDVAVLLEPITNEVERQVLESFAVKLDETGIRVLDRGQPNGVLKGSIWVYAGVRGAVRYHFTPSKEGKWVRLTLKGYLGYLQADAATSFNALYADGAVIEVGCHAHARRKFVDALATSPKEASWAIATYKKIYKIEREAKEQGLSHEELRELRQRKTKPLLEAFFTWLEELDPKRATSLVRPSSPLGKAVTYALNQREALMRFTEDGRLDPDNNRAELNLRQVAVGRKNWLFAGSSKGAERAAILYSLVVSCMELGIDPAEYLKDVIARVATTPLSRIRELTPIGWKAARDG